MVTTITISGMSCGHCVRAAETALMEILKVKSVRVVLENGEAIVDHQDADVAAMISAIEEEGFTAAIKT